MPRTLEHKVGKMMVVERFRASAMQSRKAACKKLTNMHMTGNQEDLASRSSTPLRKKVSFSPPDVSSPNESDDSEWRFENNINPEVTVCVFLSA